VGNGESFRRGREKQSSNTRVPTFKGGGGVLAQGAARGRGLQFFLKEKLFKGGLLSDLGVFKVDWGRSPRDDHGFVLLKFCLVEGGGSSASGKILMWSDSLFARGRLRYREG